MSLSKGHFLRMLLFTQGWVSSKRGSRWFQRHGLGFKCVTHLLVPLYKLPMSYVDESVYYSA